MMKDYSVINKHGGDYTFKHQEWEIRRKKFREELKKEFQEIFDTE